MAADCTLTLTVKNAPTAQGNTFLFHIDVSGQSIANNLALSAAQAAEIGALAEAYGAVFEPRNQPALTEGQLQGFGQRLFDVWLAPSWGAIEPRLTPANRCLMIAADDAAVLNLPWELLCPPDDEPLGIAGRWSVRRLPWPDRQLAAAAVRRPPPLRLLFMAAAPHGLPELDYEREEQFLLEAIANLQSEVVYDSCDLGTYGELEEKIDAFTPHIVHLCGHGAVGEDGVGYFAFEDEAGGDDPRSSAELGRLFAGSGVQCAFVSGCETGKAPDRRSLGGVCQGLVDAGLPLAIGWAASIADDVANQLARVFYDRIAKGQTVDRALTRGRQRAREICKKRGDPSWTLPVLYASSHQAELLDPRLPADSPARPSLKLQALPGMTDGHAEHFVGRRRELQRLLPALRSGRLQGVVLSGLGGAGKSTLATRLARKLEADRLVPIAISAQTCDPNDAVAIRQPIDTLSLIEAAATAFLDAGMERDEQILRDPSGGDPTDDT